MLFATVMQLTLALPAISGYYFHIFFPFQILFVCCACWCRVFVLFSFNNRRYRKAAYSLKCGGQQFCRDFHVPTKKIHSYFLRPLVLSTIFKQNSAWCLHKLQATTAKKLKLQLFCVVLSSSQSKKLSQKMSGLYWLELTLTKWAKNLVIFFSLVLNVNRLCTQADNGKCGTFKFGEEMTIKNGEKCQKTQQ